MKVFSYMNLKNMITETFVTELNKNVLMYGLISFSGETKTDNKLALISPSNNLKLNWKKTLKKSNRL